MLQITDLSLAAFRFSQVLNSFLLDKQSVCGNIAHGIKLSQFLE